MTQQKKRTKKILKITADSGDFKTYKISFAGTPEEVQTETDMLILNIVRAINGLIGYDRSTPFALESIHGTQKVIFIPNNTNLVEIIDSKE